VWLADLVQKQYIYSNYQRKKFGQNTKPSVFHLLPKAREVLKGQEECCLSGLKNIYGEDKRSKNFISNCLFLADIYLIFSSHVNRKLKLNFSTKVDLTEYGFFPDPLPDAYFVIKEPRETNRYFLLLLEEKAPRYALMGKIQKYIDYSRSNTWSSNTKKTYPSTLIICPDYPKKQFIKKFISQNYPSEDFYLTTKGTVRLKGMRSEIWEEVG
jgi:hypothetical protein